MSFQRKLAKLSRNPNRFFEDYFAKRRKRSLQPGGRDRTTLRELLDAIRYRRSKREVIPDMVVYESFHGSGMSCNPYAIFRFLLDDPRFSHLRHVWIVSKPESFRKTYAGRRNVEFVRRGSSRNVQVVSAAKYLINNNTFETWFSKSPGQVYVNTQHGVPIKTMGKDAAGTFALGANVTRNFLHTDFLVMPNRFASDVLLTSHDVDRLFAGTVIETGYPRFDTTLRSVEDTAAIRAKLGIPAGRQVILYAPTYRGSHESTVDQGESIAALLARIRQEFGERFEVLCRSHHTDAKRDSAVREQLVNQLDANELIAVADVMITDYSSVVFDYMPLRRPIIYYAYDLEEYNANRGTYLDIATLPGVVARNLHDVVAALHNLDTFVQQHGHAYDRGLSEYCSHDDGGATRRVVEHIFLGKQTDSSYRVEPSGKSRLLVYGGGFMNNGVTSSVTSLLKNVDLEKFEVYVAFNGRASAENAARFKARVPRGTRVLYYLPSQQQNARDPDEHGRNEARRIFGDATFDIAIDASGYGRLWPSMMANVTAKSRYIFLHNCMKSERETRPDLADYEYLFSLYERSYDRLINVSPSSYEANVEFLPHLESKMYLSENIVDKERILALSAETEVDPDMTNFVNIGRYAQQKGQDRLINAFAVIHARYPKTRLYIVGHGPDQHALEARARRLGLEGVVHITGKLENPFRLLKACDCFVLSSRYEGQGIVVLEALTLGVPAISTDIPGPRSILDPAFLFDDSEEGLVEGMQQFIEGKLPSVTFDVDRYNAVARQSLDELLRDQ